MSKYLEGKIRSDLNEHDKQHTNISVGTDYSEKKIISSRTNQWNWGTGVIVLLLLLLILFFFFFFLSLY